MTFRIIRDDITKVHADAIVNAANTELQCGGGVCGAIFHAAGKSELQAECDKIGVCKTGNAVITKGYKLPVKYIIHTVGPIWAGGGKNEEQLLGNCYKNSLLLAQKYDLKSVAFPLISSGVYGFPKDIALKVAISSISDFLMKNDMSVYLVVYDKESFVISERVFSSVTRYIDENYVLKNSILRSPRISQLDDFFKCQKILESKSVSTGKTKSKRRIEDVVNQIEESFSQALLRLIDEKNKTDIETYKKANIDRKLFSKIRRNLEYKPSKTTVIAFAIALELSLDETKDLLGKAGFALSHSSKFDLIVEFFINEENYNIFEINEALFTFDQPLLGD